MFLLKQSKIIKVKGINSFCGEEMPVIIFECPELNQNQREELIKGLTEAACNVIPDIPKEAYYVILREYQGEKVGVGGLTLTKYLANLQKKQAEG